MRTHKKREFYYIFNRFSAGLCSELNCLMSAMHYSQTKQYSFKVLSSQWNLSYHKGWNTYFDSLKEEHLSNSFEFRATKRYYILTSYLFAPLPKWTGLLYILHRYLFNLIIRYLEGITIYKNHSYRNNKMFLRTKCSYHLEDGKVIYGSNKMDYHNIAKSIWKLKDKTLLKVKNIKEKFKLEDYICIHIRRGDKLIREYRKYELDEYMSVVKKLNTKITKIFVMTDDYRTYQKLKKMYKDFEFISLCKKSNKGYDHNNFVDKKKAITKEINQFIVELEIARNSNYFIGTYQSNVFRFIDILKFDNCYSLG